MIKLLPVFLLILVNQPDGHYGLYDSLSAGVKVESAYVPAPEAMTLDQSTETATTTENSTTKEPTAEAMAAKTSDYRIHEDFDEDSANYTSGDRENRTLTEEKNTTDSKSSPFVPSVEVPVNFHYEHNKYPVAPVVPESKHKSPLYYPGEVSPPIFNPHGLLHHHRHRTPYTTSASVDFRNEFHYERVKSAPGSTNGTRASGVTNDGIKVRDYPYPFQDVSSIRGFDDNSIASLPTSNYPVAHNPFDHGQEHGHIPEPQHGLGNHGLDHHGFEHHGLEHHGVEHHGVEPHHLPAHGHHVTEHHGKSHVNYFHKILHFITALLPIGLFLSALTPSVLTITPVQNATNYQVPFRQRSVDVDPSLLDLLDGRAYDGENGCKQLKVLCKATSKGRLPNATNLQRALWLIATQAYEESRGPKEFLKLYKHIKNGDCDTIRCTDIFKNG